MSVTRVTWWREVRAYFKSVSCHLPVSIFLAVASWSFVMLMRRHEGSVLAVHTLWGLAVAPWLPVLSSVLTMRLFAHERSSGMLELLMSAPVREREIIVGKYLAALTIVGWSLGLAMMVPLLLLPALAEPLKGVIHWSSVVITLVILMLQSGTWCAVGLLFSVLFRNQASAAVCSLLACAGLPLGIYAAVLAWAPSLRMKVAWLPLMVHVYDFSTGLFSTAVLVLYSALTLLFLFSCSKVLAFKRLTG